MSKNGLRFAHLALGLALTLVMAPTVAGQRAETRIGFVEALMRAGFPALEGTYRPVIVTLHTAIRQRWEDPLAVQVDVYRETDATVSPSTEPTRRYLRGDFQFLRDELEMAAFSGDGVNQEKRDKYNEMQAKGLVGTDEQLAATLVRLDARFGPDKRAAFLAQVDLSRFARVLGTIEKQSVDFYSGLSSRAGYYSPAKWIARLQTRQGNSAKCFVVNFEPFRGQVEAVFPADMKVCAEPSPH
jgi:hypothetical protein